MLHPTFHISALLKPRKKSQQSRDERSLSRGNVVSSSQVTRFLVKSQHLEVIPQTIETIVPVAEAGRLLYSRPGKSFSSMHVADTAVDVPSMSD